MANLKLEEKLRKVRFTEESNVPEVVNQIIETCTDKNETIQLQINIKGYENRKDPKMTKDIVFPNIMRRDPSICVIGNAAAQEVAEKHKIPFALVSNFEAKALVRERDDLISKYKYFILCQDYQKAFNLRDILKKKRSHFMCQDVSKLNEIYETCLKTYRLKIRDWFALSFPVGHCQMPAEQIVENIKYGVQFLSDNLKKGPQNIKDCFLKRTTGANIKIY
ncbi:60S ribosomal protein L10A [Glugoides intestinalis]